MIFCHCSARLINVSMILLYRNVSNTSYSFRLRLGILVFLCSIIFPSAFSTRHLHLGYGLSLRRRSWFTYHVMDVYNDLLKMTLDVILLILEARWLMTCLMLVLNLGVNKLFHNNFDQTNQSYFLFQLIIIYDLISLPVLCHWHV